MAASRAVAAAGEGTQAVDRAISVLRLLALSPSRGLRVGTIAAAAGLHVATASRIVRALHRRGLVEHSGTERRYRLGFGAIAVGAAAGSRQLVSDEARAIVNELAERTGDSAYLCVRQGLCAVFVHRAFGAAPIRAVTVDVGTHVPLGVGAGSMAILLSLPAEEQARVLERVDPVLGEYQLTREVVAQLVRRSLAQGYTIMDGRIYRGIVSIGVPVPPGRSPIRAGLSLSAVAERLSPRRQRELARELHAAAARLQRSDPFRRARVPAADAHAGFAW